MNYSSDRKAQKAAMYSAFQKHGDHLAFDYFRHGGGPATGSDALTVNMDSGTWKARYIRERYQGGVVTPFKVDRFEMAISKDRADQLLQSIFKSPLFETEYAAEKDPRIPDILKESWSLKSDEIIQATFFKDFPTDLESLRKTCKDLMLELESKGQLVLPPFEAHQMNKDLKLISLERIPEAEKMTDIELTRFPTAQTELTLDGFKALMDAARPIKSSDTSIQGWHYVPWYSGSFKVDNVSYSFRLFLGGRGSLTLPDKTFGFFDFPPELATSHEKNTVSLLINLSDTVVNPQQPGKLQVTLLNNSQETFSVWGFEETSTGQPDLSPYLIIHAQHLKGPRFEKSPMIPKVKDLPGKIYKLEVGQSWTQDLVDWLPTGPKGQPLQKGGTEIWVEWDHATASQFVPKKNKALSKIVSSHLPIQISAKKGGHE